jgi:hypothetical protein
MEPGAENTDSVAVVAPDDISRLQTHVRHWMLLDAQLQELGQSLKRHRKTQMQLSDSITSLMRKANIEDIHTQDGTLRYQVRQVKPSISSRRVKERLVEALQQHPSEEIKRIMDSVFAEEHSGERTEKVSLRCLRKQPSS